MSTSHNDSCFAQDIPFVNDENVIGKWEYFDIVQAENQFDSNHPTLFTGDKGFKEIYFLQDGEKYWIFEGWTRGFLFIHYGGNEPVVRCRYKIREANGSMYLFLEEPAELTNGEGAYIAILKKVSDKHYTVREIGVHDNIDLPFIMDESVIGLWKSVDFVESIGDFRHDSPMSDDLHLKSVCFQDDGTAIRRYDDETWHDSWTKGALIDKKKETASAYEIKIIDNREYLFLEWKMGNYVYGGSKPVYYVFEKFVK